MQLFKKILVAFLLTLLTFNSQAQTAEQLKAKIDSLQNLEQTPEVALQLLKTRLLLGVKEKTPVINHATGPYSWKNIKTSSKVFMYVNGTEYNAHATANHLSIVVGDEIVTLYFKDMSYERNDIGGILGPYGTFRYDARTGVGSYSSLYNFKIILK